jgi:hypothetical protein
MKAEAMISTARRAPLYGRGRFDPVESPAAGRGKGKDAADARSILQK